MAFRSMEQSKNLVTQVSTRLPHDPDMKVATCPRISGASATIGKGLPAPWFRIDMIRKLQDAGCYSRVLQAI